MFDMITNFVILSIEWCNWVATTKQIFSYMTVQSHHVGKMTKWMGGSGSINFVKQMILLRFF